MSLPIQTVTQEYDGDGITTDFAIPFVFWEDSGVAVYLTDSNGVITKLILGSEYLLSGGSGEVGTASITTTPSIGEVLTVSFIRPAKQDETYSPLSNYPADAIERGLDKQAAVSQKLQGDFERGISVPIGEDGIVLDAAAARGSKIMQFSVSGEGIDLVDVSNDITTYRRQAENVEALRDFTGMVNDDTAIVLGDVTSGDGGGGDYYFDSLSTDPDNGGSVIEPNVGGNGRWLRISTFTTSRQIFTDISTLKNASGQADLEYVSVLGYLTSGDGGGGDFFWDSSSTVTANGGTIIESNITATGRWIRPVANDFNVKHFGATGDGVTDDFIPIENAVDAAIAYGGGYVYFPTGNYRIYTRINKTIEVSLAFRGDGISETKIISSDANGLLKFDFSGDLDQDKSISIMSLTMSSDVASGGPAVRIIETLGGDVSSQQFLARDVQIVSEDFDLKYFSHGFWLTGVKNPLLQNVIILGTYLGASPTIMLAGIDVQDCFGPVFDECRIQNADTGIMYNLSASPGTGLGGIKVNSCKINNCLTGISSAATVTESNFNVRHCYIQCDEFCIKINNWDNIKIIANSLSVPSSIGVIIISATSVSKFLSLGNDYEVLTDNVNGIYGLSWISTSDNVVSQNDNFKRMGSSALRTSGSTTNAKVLSPNFVDLGGVPVEDNGQSVLMSENNLIQTFSEDSGAGELKMELYRNSASPADDDVLGQFSVSGNNSSGEKKSYSQIRTDIREADSGIEESNLRVNVMEDGTLTQYFKIQVPSSNDQTGFLVRCDRGGIKSLSRVAIGGTNSGGTGWRMLRVSNS